MDIYSWIALLTMIATVFAVWKIRKRKEYKYSLLDTSCIILNFVLLVMVYPPLSVAAGLLGLAQGTMGLAIAMGRLMPAVSVAGIGASVILRRKENPGLSFLVQFAGGAWYGIPLLVGMLGGSH